MTLEGKVDAIMMTGSAYYAFVYHKRGKGEYEPEREEINRERYYELLRENPARYVEEGYTAFRLDKQAQDVLDEQARDERDYADWCEVKDSEEFERMAGRW